MQTEHVAFVLSDVPVRIIASRKYGSLLLIICFGENSPPFAVGRFDYGLPIRGIFAFGKCDCVANFDVHMHLLIRR
jgi:hypothetical protein